MSTDIIDTPVKNIHDEKIEPPKRYNVVLSMNPVLYIFEHCEIGVLTDVFNNSIDEAVAHLLYASFNGTSIIKPNVSLEIAETLVHNARAAILEHSYHCSIRALNFQASPAEQ